MKDLGQLHHFLGVTVEPRPSGLLLHQRQYTLDILERAGFDSFLDQHFLVGRPTTYEKLTQEENCYWTIIF